MGFLAVLAVAVTPHLLKSVALWFLICCVVAVLGVLGFGTLYAAAKRRFRKGK